MTYGRRQGAATQRNPPESPAAAGPHALTYRKDVLKMIGMLSNQLPPRRAWNVPDAGPVGLCSGDRAGYLSSNQSSHHSHTLPTISRAPHQLAPMGKLPTGAVPPESGSVVSSEQKQLEAPQIKRTKPESPQLQWASGTLRLQQAHSPAFVTAGDPTPNLSLYVLPCVLR